MRIAIQNAVLILLIIMILHLILKNVINADEQFTVAAPLALKKASQVTSTDDPPITSGNVAEAFASPAADCANDLYKWAYDQHIPENTTASAGEVLSQYQKERTKKSGAPVKQDQNNLVLSVYPDENIMNGGDLFPGITGFDGNVASWAEV